MIDWKSIIGTVIAFLITGLLGVACLSYNELQKLVWNMPQAMERIAAIEKKVDRIERMVRIEKNNDKVVKLIERD